MKNFILTFDIEEWFHILDIDFLEEKRNWNRFEQRVYENTQRILVILKENNIRASFFILGWIAKNYPDLVQKISDQGHEVGTHSFNHSLIYKHSPREFEKDLKESVNLIQKITNKKVRLFRAPGFSIKKDNSWAFEILAKENISIDSSVFPAKRSHGGISDINQYYPFLIKTKNNYVKEFPINVYRFFKLKLPFSGGGYFRIFPYFLQTYFWNRSNYVMTYFHPRDFDPHQPVIRDIPLFRKFKSYYGLEGSFSKLKRILKKYHFVDIATAERQINWNKVPIVKI